MSLPSLKNVDRKTKNAPSRGRRETNSSNFHDTTSKRERLHAHAVVSFFASAL